LDGVDVGTTALAAEDMVEVEGKVRTGKGAIGADETPAEDWSHTIAEAVLVVVEAGLVADNKLLGSCEVRVGPGANVSDETEGATGSDGLRRIAAVWIAGSGGDEAGLAADIKLPTSCEVGHGTSADATEGTTGGNGLRQIVEVADSGGAEVGINDEIVVEEGFAERETSRAVTGQLEGGAGPARIEADCGREVFGTIRFSDLREHHPLLTAG